VDDLAKGYFQRFAVLIGLEKLTKINHCLDHTHISTTQVLCVPLSYQDRSRKKILHPLAQWATTFVNFSFHCLNNTTCRCGSQYGNQKTNVNKLCLDS